MKERKLLSWEPNHFSQHKYLDILIYVERCGYGCKLNEIKCIKTLKIVQSRHPMICLLHLHLYICTKGRKFVNDVTHHFCLLQILLSLFPQSYSLIDFGVKFNEMLLNWASNILLASYIFLKAYINEHPFKFCFSAQTSEKSQCWGGGFPRSGLIHKRHGVFKLVS